MPTNRSKPRLIDNEDELRAAVADARADGQRIGLVPTMGALHRGHTSLVDAAVRECGFVVVTIFVNPTQFGPSEDYGRYPRTMEADLELLSQAGAHLVFAPAADDIYPPGFATYVEPGGVAELWEGAARPGHFRGVATVVLKLFNLVQADAAYFGQKDYQQLRVIEQMVADLNVPIEIRGCPIVRDPDGLALSSRNAYLSPEERRRALSLSQALQRAAELVKLGERDASQLRDRMKGVFLAAGVTMIDYIAIVDARTLIEVDQIEGPTLAAVAARVGTTRLIDNTMLEP